MKLVVELLVVVCDVKLVVGLLVVVCGVDPVVGLLVVVCDVELVVGSGVVDLPSMQVTHIHSLPFKYIMYLLSLFP